MPTVSHPHLHDRPFRSALLSVADFNAWLGRNNLHFPVPSLNDGDFLQIETLLVKIELEAGSISDEDAAAVVAADPFLASDPMASLNPRWLVGAEAHRKWRVRISEAIAAGELVPLDFGSKLPIAISDIEMAQASPSQSDTTVSAALAAEAIEEAEFIAAFAETVNNDRLIDWQYWAEQMPVWTSAQAARLMCALDPDLFERLESRPNTNDPSDLAHKAMKIQRLAEARGIIESSPLNWLKWADGLGLKVHSGLRLALNAQTEAIELSRAISDQDAWKLAAGRFTLEEAAEAIDGATAASGGQMLIKLLEAARAGTLPMFAPGATARYVYGLGAGGPVRSFYEEAYWDDLNAWLEANEPRLEFAFPAPSTAKQVPSTAAVPQKPSGLTKEQIVTAFGSVIASDLAKAMADGAKWTVPAKLSSGTKGGRHASMWDPVLMASALQDKKKVAVTRLNQAFNSHNFLSPWREEWSRVSTM